MILPLILVACAGCAPGPYRSTRTAYLRLSPAILVLAQQAQLAHLEGRNPAILSTPLERVDSRGRLDLVIGYRGTARRILPVLKSLGARIVARPTPGHWVEAWVPARHVASLARIPGIATVSFPHRAVSR